MCSRFALTRPPEEIRRAFGYAAQPNFPPRYNIAPTQPIAIVRASGRDATRAIPPASSGIAPVEFALARWGFLPSFVKDPNEFPLLFNARAESLGERPSFRNALRRRRCLVPADAFYEWQRAGIGKGARSRAYLGRRADGRTMGLAGLWETWVGPNGEEVDTACIITTAANGVSAAIHPRLPVMIEPSAEATWLDPDETAMDAAAALLKTPANDVLTFVPVSDAVNKVGTEGPQVQIAIGDPLAMPAPAAHAPVQPSLF